jgi:opacity protein-like surface antigen
LVIVVAHGAARAAEPEPKPDYGRTGIYLGVAGTYGLENFDAPGPVDNSLGVNARVGYRVIPRLAFEVQAEWVEGFRLKGTGVDVETWVMTANARAYFTEARIQPYLLVGIGFLTGDAPGIRATGFAVRAGGGVDIGVTDRIAVVLEVTYAGATGKVSGLGHGSIVWGLQYRF